MLKKITLALFMIAGFLLLTRGIVNAKKPPQDERCFYFPSVCKGGYWPDPTPTPEESPTPEPTLGSD